MYQAATYKLAEDKIFQYIFNSARLGIYER
jgi:hypothetical protein